MRSDLVFDAKVHVPNRYQLVRVLSAATRALHRPGTRIEDTMNDVLVRCGQANPIAHRNLSRVFSSPTGSPGKTHSSRNGANVLELEKMADVDPIQISPRGAASGTGQFPPSARMPFPVVSAVRQAPSAK
jgi:hypothetical protein